MIQLCYYYFLINKFCQREDSCVHAPVRGSPPAAFLSLTLDTVCMHSLCYSRGHTAARYCSSTVINELVRKFAFRQQK